MRVRERASAKTTRTKARATSTNRGGKRKVADNSWRYKEPRIGSFFPLHCSFLCRNGPAPSKTSAGCRGGRPRARLLAHDRRQKRSLEEGAEEAEGESRTLDDILTRDQSVHTKLLSSKSKNKRIRLDQREGLQGHRGQVRKNRTPSKKKNVPIDEFLGDLRLG